MAVSQAGYLGLPITGYAGAYGYASPIRAAIAPLPIARTYAAAPALTVAAAPAVVAKPAIVAKAAPVAVAAAPAVVAKAAPAAAGVHATQYHAQDELSNYEFGYQNPNSARTEKGNAELGTVSGSYTSPNGVVNYVADAYGFRIVGGSVATPIAPLARLHKRSVVAGLGYAIPTGTIAATGYGLPAPALDAVSAATTYGAGVAPLTYGAQTLSAPAAREAVLETVKLNPGHAVAYRVY